MNTPIAPEIPENTLWTSFHNGKGEQRKGWVVIAKKDDRYFSKGQLYQLVFKEPGDMDYHENEINADLFKDERRVIGLFWRSWQAVTDTFEFVPQKHQLPLDL